MLHLLKHPFYKLPDEIMREISSMAEFFTAKSAFAFASDDRCNSCNNTCSGACGECDDTCIGDCNTRCNGCEGGAYSIQ
jgi:hypothetical protein